MFDRASTSRGRGCYDVSNVLVFLRVLIVLLHEKYV